MNRTHLSLYYLAGYLIPTGIGLMAAPGAIIRMLGSTIQYDLSFPRFLGVMLLSLGIIVAQILRLKVEQLYPTTMLVRLLIVPWLIVIYLESRDPLFLAIFGVVAFGLALTTTCYLIDRSKKASP